jgi:ribosomal protein L34
VWPLMRLRNTCGRTVLTRRWQKNRNP